MKARYAVAAALACGSIAFAQEKAPQSPSGTKRLEADHREFITQVRTTEWRAPGGVEGFTTYFPDGLFITTMKLKDGALAHTMGSYRINGDVWCQTTRLPADSKESCSLNYRTGENSFETWRPDGATFVGYWNYKMKK